ncbi:MAG: hypothetical protein AAF528_01195 [Cyanobacteria bacterium P01_C01_bin.121]
MEDDEVWEHTPHGVWNLTCSRCGHEATHIMPFPFPSDSVECGECGHLMPVSSDPPDTFSTMQEADDDS